MESCFALAAAAAVLVACLAPPARAGCVISPDGKTINVVTDNGASEEKNCAVKCQVDTRIGVVQVSCGGNTPPLAKAHSLCGFDKPEPYYRKVLSSEDSCKGAPGNAVPAMPPIPEPPKAGAPPKAAFACRILPDGQSAEAVITNPYPQNASCSVDCQIASTRAGTTFQFSCTRTAAAGAGEVVLCRQSFTRGKLVKTVGGKGECTNPAVPDAAAEKDKDDDDDDKLAEEMLKKSQQMLEMLKKR